MDLNICKYSKKKYFTNKKLCTWVLSVGFVFVSQSLQAAAPPQLFDVNGQYLGFQDTGFNDGDMFTNSQNNATSIDFVISEGILKIIGDISRIADISKWGLGTLVIEGNNTCTHGLYINQGQVIGNIPQNCYLVMQDNTSYYLGGNNQSASYLNDYSSSTIGLQESPTNTTARILEVNTSTSFTSIQSKLIGTGGVSIYGSQIFYLLNSENSYSGPTTIHTNAILNISSSANIGNGDLVLNGGTIQFDYSGTFDHVIQLLAHSTLDLAGHNLTLLKEILGENYNLSIVDSVGGGTITFDLDCLYNSTFTGEVTFLNGVQAPAVLPLSSISSSRMDNADTTTIKLIEKAQRPILNIYNRVIDGFGQAFDINLYAIYHVPVAPSQNLTITAPQATRIFNADDTISDYNTLDTSLSLDLSNPTAQTIYKKVGQRITRKFKTINLSLEFNLQDYKPNGSFFGYFTGFSLVENPNNFQMSADESGLIQLYLQNESPPDSYDFQNTQFIAMPTTSSDFLTLENRYKELYGLSDLFGLDVWNHFSSRPTGVDSSSSFVATLSAGPDDLVSAFIATESALNQTTKAKKVMIVFDPTLFPSSSIDHYLFSKQINRGLYISFFSKSTYYSLNILPAMRFNSSSHLIPLSPNCSYPSNFFDTLLDKHNSYPNDVLCINGFIIEQDTSSPVKKITSSDSWKEVKNDARDPSTDLIPFITSGGFIPARKFSIGNYRSALSNTFSDDNFAIYLSSINQNVSLRKIDTQGIFPKIIINKTQTLNEINAYKSYLQNVFQRLYNTNASLRNVFDNATVLSKDGMATLKASQLNALMMNAIFDFDAIPKSIAVPILLINGFGHVEPNGIWGLDGQQQLSIYTPDASKDYRLFLQGAPIQNGTVTIHEGETLLKSQALTTGQNRIHVIQRKSSATSHPYTMSFDQSARPFSLDPTKRDGRLLSIFYRQAGVYEINYANTSHNFSSDSLTHLYQTPISLENGIYSPESNGVWTSGEGRFSIFRESVGQAKTITVSFNGHAYRNSGSYAIKDLNNQTIQQGSVSDLTNGIISFDAIFSSGEGFKTYILSLTDVTSPSIQGASADTRLLGFFITSLSLQNQA